MKYSGDKVLKEFAKLINENIRENDVFGRVGGEEFALIIFEAESDEVFVVLESIRKTIENMSVTFEDEMIKITCSIGFALVDATIKDFQEVMKLSDNNLYEAKESGRNRVVK